MGKEWTEIEKEKWNKLVKQFGKNYKLVSEGVETKSEHQCHIRGWYVLKKLKEKCWDEELKRVLERRMPKEYYNFSYDERKRQAIFDEKRIVKQEIKPYKKTTNFEGQCFDLVDISTNSSTPGNSEEKLENLDEQLIDEDEEELNETEFQDDILQLYEAVQQKERQVYGTPEEIRIAKVAQQEMWHIKRRLRKQGVEIQKESEEDKE